MIYINLDLGLRKSRHMAKYLYTRFDKILNIYKRRCTHMNFLKDEAGQGAAEYILLFGGVIVIAIAALVIYKAYFGQQLRPKRRTMM